MLGVKLLAIHLVVGINFLQSSAERFDFGTIEVPQGNDRGPSLISGAYEYNRKSPSNLQSFTSASDSLSESNFDESDSDSLEGAIRFMQRKKKEIISPEMYSRDTRYRYPFFKRFPHTEDEKINELENENDWNSQIDENGQFFELPKVSEFRERMRIRPDPTFQNFQLPDDFEQSMKHKKSASFLPSFGDVPEDQYYDVPIKKNRYPQLVSFRDIPADRSNRIDEEKLEILSNVIKNLDDIPQEMKSEEMANPQDIYVKTLEEILREYKGKNGDRLLDRKKREVKSLETNSTPKTENNSNFEKAQRETKITLQKSKQDRRKRANGYNAYRREQEENRLARQYFKTLAKFMKKRRDQMSNLAPKFQHKKSGEFMDLKSRESFRNINLELKEQEDRFDEIADVLTIELKKIPYLRNAKEKKEMVKVINKLMKDIFEAMAKIQELEQIKKHLPEMPLRPRQVSYYEDIPAIEENMRTKTNKKRISEEETKENKEEEEKMKNDAEETEEENKEGEKEKMMKRMNEMKSGSDAFNTYFGSNKKEDCPVLEKILKDCAVVSSLVGDKNFEFVEACLEHEMCYMCGSGMDVGVRECEAVFSSTLEKICLPRRIPQVYNQDGQRCLGSAGMIMNLLADPQRYDGRGSCTFDPCIREFLDSR